MPVANEAVQTAFTFQKCAEILNKSIAGLTPEEWLRQPGERANHLLWIVGHVIWTRSIILKLLGTEWTRPWLGLFGRGAKLEDATHYPSPAEIAQAWQEMETALNAAFEKATPAALSAPAPERIPTLDGKLSGTLAFLAFHESYHAGQAAYLRTWLGHEGVAG